jgi:mono/diheme cytochrome c family protein
MDVMNAESVLMRLQCSVAAFRPALLAVALCFAMPVHAQPAAPAQPSEQDLANFDVGELFAGTCGFCHSDGGRAAGKGPQLMGDQHDDDFLRNRIKNGKPGAMPAFGATFNDQQIDAIIIYIRDLKPR